MPEVSKQQSLAAITIRLLESIGAQTTIFDMYKSFSFLGMSIRKYYTIKMQIQTSRVCDQKDGTIFSCTVYATLCVRIEFAFLILAQCLNPCFLVGGLMAYEGCYNV